MWKYFSFIDYLSPSITLFYYGKKSHSSIFGGILTILMCACTVSLLAYYCWVLFTHQNPNVYVYKQFEYEAGTYYFNASGFYHFIQMFAYNEEREAYYDPSAIRFFMTRKSLIYTYDQSVINDEHWLYDKCEESDKQGLDEKLFKNVGIFQGSACIKYYYNPTAKKYYKYGDPNYKDPYVWHGNARKDYQMLATIGVKCKNDTIMSSVLGTCKTEKEIDDYLLVCASIGFHMIDHQVDPNIYDKPLQKFFYDITSAISTTNIFPHHNINFAPVRVKSNVGYVFDSFVEQTGYHYIDNRKGSKTTEDGVGIIIELDYWLNNNVDMYLRTYKSILDLLPNIGGVTNVIFFLFQILNYFYHNYIVLQNTKTLFTKINSGLNDTDNCLKHENSNAKMVNLLKTNANDPTKGMYAVEDVSNVKKIIINKKLKKKNSNERDGSKMFFNSSLEQGGSGKNNLSILNENEEGSKNKNIFRENSQSHQTDNMDKKSKNSSSKGSPKRETPKQNLSSSMIKRRKFNSKTISKKLSKKIHMISEKDERKSPTNSMFALNKNLTKDTTSISDENNHSKDNINNNNNQNQENERQSQNTKDILVSGYDRRKTTKANINNDNLKIVKKNKKIIRYLTHNRKEESNQELSDIKETNDEKGPIDPMRKVKSERRREENEKTDDDEEEKYDIKNNYDEDNENNENNEKKEDKDGEFDDKTSDNKQEIGHRSHIRNVLKQQYGVSKNNFKTNKMQFIDSNFNFCDYFINLCHSKKKKNNGLYMIDHFRKKLLSEEHLYRNHINLYYMEKFFELEEKENQQLIELYKNL